MASIAVAWLEFINLAAIAVVGRRPIALQVNS